MSTLKADMPLVKDGQDPSQGPVPEAARPAERLSSIQTMMKCVHTAGGSVDGTKEWIEEEAEEEGRPA